MNKRYKATGYPYPYYSELNYEPRYLARAARRFVKMESEEKKRKRLKNGMKKRSVL